MPNLEKRPGGYNPMKWNCEKDGCFNLKRRPKIEQFAGGFPRNGNFGDVDGWIELNGAFAMLEWKGEGGVLKDSQRHALIRFTKQDDRNIVYYVEGDPETMRVDRYAIVRHGWFPNPSEYVHGSLDDLRSHMWAWGNWADKTPRRVK